MVRPSQYLVATFLFVLEWVLIAFDNRGVDIWRRVLHLDTIQNEEDEEFDAVWLDH